jgi:hypothetical protein
LREGTAPDVIRRKAATGELPLSLVEKIEALVLLSQIGDEATRNTAYCTLQTWQPEELEAVLENPDTPVEVLDFAANHLARERPNLRDALLRNPALPPDLRDWVGSQTCVPEVEGVVQPAPAPLQSAGDEGETDPQRLTLLQRVARLTTAEKIKLALTGNQEERLVLVRDSNKIVARAVLQSPKVTDLEIESFASMKNVAEEVLRLIAINRKFMKSYAVVRQLVSNPRTPIEVSLPLLNRLNDRDLKIVSLNRNVPEVIRGMALKAVKRKAEASKPKPLGKKH